MDQKDINSFLYSLYDDVSPAAVSIECRKKHGIYDDKSLVYAESYLPSLYEIFSEVNPKPGEIFYDLGSGSGRLVFYVALNFPFAKCIGVELLDDLVSLAQKKLELLEKKLFQWSGFEPNKLGEIKFVKADFTKMDVSDAGVIYIATTCFTEKFMRDLALLLEQQLSSGTRIITLSKNLPSEKFKIIKNKIYPMEWGEVMIFFNEKI